MTAYDRREAQETVDRIRHALEHPPSEPVRRRIPIQPSSPQGRLETELTSLPEYEILKIKRAVGDIAGIDNPFYRLHDGRACEVTSMGGRTIVNFSSYDYLGLNGHPGVASAAKRAIDLYGTSVSASRISAGERQVHRDLEVALANLHGTEAAVAFVSGHATNVSVIGSLLGPEDLIVSDAAIHQSVLDGIKLAGAKRILCPHGDIESFDRALRLNRARYRRALIVVEGLYSMDGDVADLAALIKLKRRYSAWLMVDEAHSAGVLGATGRGLAEEQGIDPAEVDIWMGTLSKTFAASGGYIAGSRPLIELIKYTTSGFVFSVGLSPPIAAAATAAIELMAQETWRLAKLRENGRAFLKAAQDRQLDTGLSIGAAVIPIIVGNSPHAVILSERLLARGYNVVSAIFPGVAENQARIRFFITSGHSPQQIHDIIDAVADELPKVRNSPSFIQMMGKHNLAAVERPGE